ncbi:hypothetical protein LUZ63_021071 [Rhynchospora breviuscula]|uniref:Probable nicotinate-nucleotide pyrophosphorylase [carboxylating] n=1 Tax=Rhynchospora breviuscula TaxID=2022672 RepID=A0A9P9Z8S1_9POAL|nr:hypothetical protein LUZ63_021071 [Rhynchospora breviuscula]
MAAQGGRPVRLDATALGAERLARRFPTIDAAVRARGLDWARDPIPVTPAAHYLMGGVVTDLDGRTTLPGLYAVGETARTGVHGANRLASNSLLEGAVFGARAGEAAATDATWPAVDAPAAVPLPDVTRAADAPPFSRRALQQLMWDHAGLVRDDPRPHRVDRGALPLRRVPRRGTPSRPGGPRMLTRAAIDRVVAAALEEDAPWGDLTSETLIPADATARAELVAREIGVFSGAEVFRAAFRLTDPRVEVELRVADGAEFVPGEVLAVVSGPARAVLTAERIGLNFVQRMSGIATLTSRYVAAVAHTGARIVDTRKTTPGLRAIERQAVRDGGGHNHRFSLSDAVMAKDNHLAVLAAGGMPLTQALESAIARLPHTAHVEVEVDRLDQIDAVLAAGVDTIMLDNFSLDDLRAGVERIAGSVVVEASGGVTLDTVRAIAETGVDVISVGALTHSAPALDLGLDIRIQTA